MAHRTPDLPVHFRTGLRALGIVNGRPVWPVLGGEESDDAAAQAAARVAADAAAQGAKSAAGDKGFPDGTPLEQMTSEQRESYWKHQARKHEDRVRAFGGRTPEQIAEAFEKAEKHDALELELSSEADKKAADARKTAAEERDAFYRPLLVRTKFEAVAAGRIEPDKLATILEPLDLSKFLAADGTPDADKVRAYVDGIAPATTQQAQRPGPTAAGQGNRSGNTRTQPGMGTVSAGRDLYAEMHPKKAS